MDDKTPDDDGLRPYADLYPEDGDVFRDPNWEEDPPGSGVWRGRRELRERLDGERMRRLMNRWLGEPSDDGDPLPFVDLYPEDGNVFDDPNWEEDPPGSGIWQVRRELRERLALEAAERLMRRRLDD